MFWRGNVIILLLAFKVSRSWVSGKLVTLIMKRVKKYSVMLDTLEVYSTESLQTCFKISNCFCLGCGRAHNSAWEQIKLFHIHKLFHRLIFSLHNLSWLSNICRFQIYRNSLTLPRVLNINSGGIYSDSLITVVHKKSAIPQKYEKKNPFLYK